MNILYYIPSISRNHGGIFQYSLRVLEDIIKTDHNFIVLNNTDPLFFQEYFGNYSNVTVVSDKNNSFSKKLVSKFKRIISALSSEIRILKNYPHESVSIDILKKFKIDLVHSPAQGYPNIGVPFIFTLHDVQELHMPEYFTPIEREGRAKNNRIGCENAERIVVSYNHVKQDLVKYFGVDEKRIDVVFIGTTDNNLVPRVNSLKISSNYILYPAATWPHKNHTKLLKSLKRALELSEEMKEYKLVCTGHKTPHYNLIIETIKELNLQDKVEFKGTVSYPELKQLYSNCRAVIVPTKYEAGSFPLMESMVQTIPVICSNVTSLPETIENPKFCFDPDNIEEMAKKIIQICTDYAYRKENIENSIQIKPRLINRDLASEFSNIYQKCS